jgi:hypothetical protein
MALAKSISVVFAAKGDTSLGVYTPSYAETTVISLY